MGMVCVFCHPRMTGCPWITTQQHSGRGQDAGWRAEFAPREACYVSGRAVQPLHCCHLNGAALDGSLRVAFQSAILLHPSSEAAKAEARFQRDCQLATYSKILRPEIVQDPRTPYSILPLPGIPRHKTFLPCNLLKASSTLVPHSTLVGPTGRQAVRIKDGKGRRLIGHQPGTIAPKRQVASRLMDSVGPGSIHFFAVLSWQPGRSSL